MNTEYSVGKLRIRFESRARRRCLVVLIYVFLAVFDLAFFPETGRSWLHSHMAWFTFGLLVLGNALMKVFAWLPGDMHKRGDERETQRREHAFARAYHVLGGFLAAAFLASCLNQGPNPIAPRLPIAWQAYLAELPFVLLVATGSVYITLPQAILLWTEPDMEANPEPAIR